MTLKKFNMTKNVPCIQEKSKRFGKVLENEQLFSQ